MLWDWFSSGEIDALVAIKCLDEGVDIPSIEKAFILASTTNPKEFIQRRGRVLRPSPGTNKEKAIIYDFVTLPHHTSKFSEGLVKRELKRVVEFNLDAINKSENIKIINDLVSDYDIMEDGNEK